MMHLKYKKEVLLVNEDGYTTILMEITIAIS